MKCFEDELGDFRGKVYESFREIIGKLSVGNKVVISPALDPIILIEDGGSGNSYFFRCDSVEMMQDGTLYFGEGDYTVHESEIDTDQLVLMHDEIVNEYELDN